MKLCKDCRWGVIAEVREDMTASFIKPRMRWVCARTDPATINPVTGDVVFPLDGLCELQRGFGITPAIDREVSKNRPEYCGMDARHYEAKPPSSRGH